MRLRSLDRFFAATGEVSLFLDRPMGAGEEGSSPKSAADTAADCCSSFFCCRLASIEAITELLDLKSVRDERFLGLIDAP